MRLANMPFIIEDYNSVTICPSGVLPTLDTGDLLVGPNAGLNDQTIDGSEAADAILAHLRKVKDLDSSLGAKELGEMHAFAALVSAKLIPATVYFTFIDPVGYKKHTQGEYAANMPMPLNYINPWRWREAMRKKWGALDPKTVVADAQIVYGAVAAHIGDQEYFCGDRPSSLDAVLFAHLNYHYHAPVCESDLRPLLQKHPALVRYVERLSEKHFRNAPPRPPPAIELTREERVEMDQMRDKESKSWREWIWGTKSSVPKPQRTEKEKNFKRRSQMFMAFMASAVAAYLLISDVVEVYSDDEDEEGDE